MRRSALLLVTLLAIAPAGHAGQPSPAVSGSGAGATTLPIATGSTYPGHIHGHRIYDSAAILTDSQIARLEALTAEVAAATTVEINVVVVDSLHGDTVEAYANALFNDWAIGRADTNNGLLFLIAPREHRVRIEVSYGLEPLVTDAVSGEILDTQVLPAFKAGQYGQGIINGTQALAERLQRYPEDARGSVRSAPGLRPSG